MAEKVTLRETYQYEPKLPDMAVGVGGLSGLLVHMAKNHHYRLPYSYRAKIQIPLFVLTGTVLGMVFAETRRSFVRRRLLRVEAYIATHPEDFIEPTPKKFGDVLLPWHPTR